MIAPTYFGPRDLDEFLGTWAEIARELSGLHAGLAFERMIRDLHESEEAQSLTYRDLHRDIESLEGDLERVRGW